MPRTRGQALAKQQAGLVATPPEALPVSKGKRPSRPRKQVERTEAGTSSQVTSSEPPKKRKSRETNALSTSAVKPTRHERQTSESEESGEHRGISQKPMPFYASILNRQNYDESGNLILGGKREPDADEDDFEALPLEPEPVSLQGRLRAHRNQQLARKAAEEATRIAALEAPRVASQQLSTENDPAQVEQNHTTNGTQNVDEVAHSSSVTLTTSQGDTQAIPESPTPAETPNRAWGLISLLGSVTKFVPGLRRQLHTIPETFTDRDEPQADLTVQLSQPITHSGKGSARQTRVSSMTSAQRKALKEQRRARKEEEAGTDEQRKVEEQRKAEAERSERRIAEEVERRVQERLKSHKAAEVAEPGQKRKRYSPDTIPNPKGSSYGMDINFFGDSSSSDEEDETAAPDNSPSLRRATKRPRFNMDAPSTPPKQILGDPHHARPYMGVMFADPKPNMFSQSGSKASTSDSRPPPIVSFSVPDESSDEDEPAAPPPRPTPSHATLPSENPHHALPSDNNAALERARSQALKYTPKHPSSLRTASRLSSSTMASDVGEVSEIPATTNATTTIIPAAATVEAPSQITTRAPLGDVSGNSIAKSKVDSYTMQLGKDQLIKFDFLVLAGQDITTNPKILAYLDSSCTPAVMESNRRTIEADKAQWMTAAAAAEVY